MLLVQFQVMPWGGLLSYLLRHSRLQCDKSKVRLRIYILLSLITFSSGGGGGGGYVSLGPVHHPRK